MHRIWLNALKNIEIHFFIFNEHFSKLTPIIVFFPIIGHTNPYYSHIFILNINKSEVHFK
jgi:hypothetical protein